MRHTSACASALLLAAAAVAAVLAAEAKVATDGAVELVEQQPGAYKALPEPVEESAEERDKSHAAIDAYIERFLREQAEHPARKPEDLAPSGNTTSLLERLIGKQQQGGCGVDETSLPVPRDYLVVLPAGDDFDASKWLDRPDRANWDLVVIYYGSAPNFSCRLCRAVYAASGPKWRLAHRFTLLPEWAAYKQRYQAIMLPDDDLVMDTCTANKVFNVLRAYDLLMAQPSLCPAAWSHTPWKMLYNQPQNILRFTTFNEIMIPVYQMDFFDAFVRPSLYNAHYGWGLDFVWPFLLKYPRDKIAVIDEVCIYHPPSLPQKGNSVYAAQAPYKQKEEESRRFAEYGYWDSEVAARGYWFQPVEVLGVVPKPASPEGLLETSNKAGGVLSERLGLLYPVLLLGQSLLIAAGCLGVMCLGLRRCAVRRLAYRPLTTSAVV